jgi:hypothetical protein
MLAVLSSAAFYLSALLAVFILEDGEQGRKTQVHIFGAL